MSFADDAIFQWLSQYAYQPEIVYLAVLGMMLASAFGLPVPEEVTIISVGVLAFMGSHPAVFPPPFEGAPVVQPIPIAIYTTFVVLLADYLVFSIGRFLGDRASHTKMLKPIMTGPAMTKVNSFIKRYGQFATFIFRFTPGLRFPAHIALGSSGFSRMKFLVIDFFACLISIPTQILLVAYYGEEILSVLYKFKHVVFLLLLVAGLVYLAKKMRQRYATRSVG